MFTKWFAPNWSGKIFVIRKIKTTVPWTYVINNLNSKEIIGTCYEKELQSTNKKEFRIEKVVKEKRKWAICQMQRTELRIGIKHYQLKNNLIKLDHI